MKRLWKGLRHTLRNRDSTNFLREIRVGLRASRKGPFGTKEKRVQELEKRRLQFFQRLLRPLDRETCTRKDDDQSIIMDFRLNGERAREAEWEAAKSISKCAKVHECYRTQDFHGQQRRHKAWRRNDVL